MNAQLTCHRLIVTQQTQLAHVYLGCVLQSVKRKQPACDTACCLVDKHRHANGAAMSRP